MKSQSILIYVQEKAVREALNIVLTDEGFFCYSSKSEETFVRKLDTKSISLVIVDSQVLRSTYFLENFKEAYPQIKIIIISAYSDVDLTQRALILGADDFVLKPLDFDELIARIRTHLLPAA